MKRITLLGYGLFAALAFTGCQSSDDSSPEENSFYKIINNGGAGATSITDESDMEPLSIAQAIPSVPGQQYPVKAPVVFFMNDKVLIPSINEDTFIVKENGNQVSGIISVNEASNGYAIVTFTPNNEFSANAEIEVTLTTGIQDDGGQPLAQDK